MKKAIRLIAIAVVTATLSGCATTARTTTAERTNTAAQTDWDALFSAFAEKDTEPPSPKKQQAAAFFSAHREATAEAVTKAITKTGYPREAFSGACDAAGYIKAAKCLPAIEAKLLAETDWFLRYACANAIDSIDAASSQNSVIAALDTEKNGLVAMLCAMYLTRHPVANSRDLLDRKHIEFSAKTDESSVIACIFLEDAILALNAEN